MTHVAAPDRLERFVADAAARYLPSRVLRTGRKVYRSLRPPEPVLGRSIELPDDVADAEEVRAFLRDTDIFGTAGHEADAYLYDSFERFRLTMALLPELPKEARVLELGANPYFITRLLARRGLEPTCANWFGAASGIGSRGKDVVTAPLTGERHTFEFDHFNVEADTFPYETGSFDVVLCCEILEHLPHNPTHMLAEIHRVLRQPTGRLVLTTPNAVRYDNQVRMDRGENVYEELSGYGTYGRHNREYTVAELETLFEELGFEVDEVFSYDVHPPSTERPELGPTVDPHHRGDNLFAVARPIGEPRWRYPRWLYSSQHAYRKLVRSDLVMGCNDEVQAQGFHPLERFGDVPGRWTGTDDEAIVLIELTHAEPAVLEITGWSPPPAAGTSTRLRAAIGRNHLTWSIDSKGAPFTVRAPVHVSPGHHEIILTTDTFFVPRDLGAFDPRRLGIGISTVRFLPAPDRP